MTAFHMALYGWTTTRAFIPSEKWRAAMRWLMTEIGADHKAPISKFLAASEEAKARFMEMVA